MNTFKLITAYGGTQHAIATADGVRYDMYIIGGTLIPFEYIERATAAAAESDNITEAARASLTADGVSLNGVDVIVTSSAAPSAASATIQTYSLNAAATSLIEDHAAAITDILRGYGGDTSTTAIEAHVNAIRNITRTLHNLRTVQTCGHSRTFSRGK